MDHSVPVMKIQKQMYKFNLVWVVFIGAIYQYPRLSKCFLYSSLPLFGYELVCISYVLLFCTSRVSEFF